MVAEGSDLSLDKLRALLSSKANPEKAKVLQGFFRTGNGEYGEGDIFLGVTVPETRKAAKEFYEKLGLADILTLLKSGIHEERLCGLLMLVQKFRKDDPKEKKRIFDFYISHARMANNWDLVDLSADKICGAYLVETGKDSERQILYRLAKSDNVWERRIAIISTFAFIKKGGAEESFKISEMLLQDRHDLIHKAVGWMLREAGKRVSLSEEENFLKKHCHEMPRTMLRYAIEKFPDKKRKSYLNKKYL